MISFYVVLPSDCPNLEERIKKTRLYKNKDKAIRRKNDINFMIEAGMVKPGPDTIKHDVIELKVTEFVPIETGDNLYDY